ncbi:MAG: hypothetical protein ACHQX1_01420 [Candidatus Micrarchaeales archaeon]
MFGTAKGGTEVSEVTIKDVARQESSQQTTNPVREKVLEIVSEIASGKSKVSGLAASIIKTAEDAHNKYQVYVPGRIGPAFRLVKITYSNLETNSGFHTEYGSILSSAVVMLIEEAIKQKEEDRAVVRIADAISEIFSSTALSPYDYAESYFGSAERLKDNIDSQPALLTLAYDNADVPHIVRYKVKKIADDEQSSKADSLSRR